MQEFFSHLSGHVKHILVVAGIIIGALLLGLILKYILFSILKAYHKNKQPVLTLSIVKHLNRPNSFFLPLLFLSFMLPLVPLQPGPFEFIRRLNEILLIITFAWVLINAVYVVEDLIRHHYQINKEDNIRERKLFTQLQFIKRIVVILIAFFAVSLILMSFATVRKIGTGLITSAGILSVIVGFAAQRSIANLLAGFQLAFTQPIRIDDVLVVENEFGRVEEISLTYVVLRIWDDRRLILPLNYFIEKPFQNWTRINSEVLGTVFIYTDYMIPIGPLREELKRITLQSKFWDGRVSTLQVTEAKEKTLELRVLLSAANSGSAFDLRCEVREKLITYIRENYPDCLPKTRAIIEPRAGGELISMGTSGS